MSITLLILLWVVCGALSYGLMFAFFQRGFIGIADYTYWADFRVAFIPALTGPIALAATLYFLSRNTFKHGFKFK